MTVHFTNCFHKARHAIINPHSSLERPKFVRMINRLLKELSDRTGAETRLQKLAVFFSEAAGRRWPRFRLFRPGIFVIYLRLSAGICKMRRKRVRDEENTGNILSDLIKCLCYWGRNIYHSPRMQLALASYKTVWQIFALVIFFTSDWLKFKSSIYKKIVYY